MKKIITAVLLISYAALAAYAVNKVAVEKPTEAIELGYVVVGLDDDGEGTKVAVYKGVNLVLRPDGTVGWKMSKKLRERFDRDMKSGKPLPILLKTK